MVDNFEQDQIIVDGNKVTYHNMNYFMVELNDKFRTENFLGHDVILLNLSEERLINFCIREIRTHTNPEIYLKPVFVISVNEYSDVVINSLCDGFIPSINHLDQIEPHIVDLLSKIGRINHPKIDSFESHMINRTLGYLFSRGRKELQAVPYFHSGIGYYYPELSVNFDHRDEFTVLKILRQAEMEGLFQSDFLQRVYLCTNCNGGYLNYREVCPKCQSSNSSTQDLVHHFPCAYVGPMSDFTNEIDDQLNCPKCNKSLRHIGVDYDKPSVLYTCNHCHHKYQDYYTKAKCLTCHTENDVEHLSPFSINNYTVTKKGEAVALNGYINLEQKLNKIEGTVALDMFNVLLQYETQRLTESGYQTNIGYLHIDRMAQVGVAIGIDNQKLLMADILNVLKSTLAPADFISFYNSSTFIFSIVHKSSEEAQKLMQDMMILINRMLKKTFPTVEIQISTNTVGIGLQNSPDQSINSLMHPLNSL